MVSLALGFSGFWLADPGCGFGLFGFEFRLGPCGFWFLGRGWFLDVLGSSWVASTACS